MNTKMKKRLCLLLTVVMLAALPVSLAASRFPAHRGAVTDDADVLGTQIVSEIGQYAKKLEKKTDIQINVVLVHFLDGLEAESYAEQLFETWELSENDMLILGAAGEDSFAAVMGSKVQKQLGEKNAENLMFTSSQFSTLFRQQQYDEAFSEYFRAFNALVEKQTGETIRLGDWFGAAAVQAKPAEDFAKEAKEFASGIWSEVADNIDNARNEFEKHEHRREKEHNGLSAGGWIVLVILIMIIFTQSDPIRKARRKRNGTYRSYGCGCSPIG